jgi:hypothetical protein
MRMRRIALAVLLCAPFVAARLGAVTPLLRVRYSPDVTTTVTSLTVGPGNVANETLTGVMGPTSLVAIGSIPDGVKVDGYGVDDNGFHLLSFDTTVVLGATTYFPSDVVRYNGSSYTLVFSGSAQGVPDGVNVDEVSALGTDLLLSFDTTVKLSGTTFFPEDVARWNGATFTSYFTGTAAGVPAGANVDGVELLPNGHILFSLDVTGKVGGVDFNDDDVLEYTPGAPGTWEKAYNGSTQQPTGWPPADLGPVAACGMDAFPPTATYNTGTICQGGTLQLNGSSTVSGLFYAWSGPGGFTSTLQNPTIPNATQAANGGTSCSSATMVGVTIPVDAASPTVTAPATATVTQTVCQ